MAGTGGPGGLGLSGGDGQDQQLEADKEAYPNFRSIGRGSHPARSYCPQETRESAEKAGGSGHSPWRLNLVKGQECLELPFLAVCQIRGTLIGPH